LDEVTLDALGVKLQAESQEEKKGIFGKIGAGVKTAGEAVAEGTVVGAQATAKGATTAGKATAKGATTAGKATAEGSTVAAKKTAEASTTAGKATVKGTTTAGKAVKGVFTPPRSDAEILYEIQDRFKENPQIDPAHFDVGVSDGVVTLTQRKGTASELDQATVVAKQVKGVKKVVSKRQ
jgi:osmotically-inducible protein OsmY